MKAIILKQNLLDAINVVQKAVMAKATLPILEGIYVEATDILKLVGNCFDLGIEYTVEADIKEKGSVVINAKMFGEIIRRLPDAPVSIEVLDGSKVRIECLNSYFEIKGMEGDTYPLPPAYQDEMSITIPEASLRDLLRQTIFAVGTDENRKIMTGALLEADNGEIRIAALDGFRMAVSHSFIKEDVKFKVVIPGKNMNEILRVLDTSSDPITVSLSGSLVSFVLKNCRIVSKVLDGEFMNYKSYIPAQFETVINASTKELIESLERASLITSDDKRYPVRFNISDDTLMVSSTAEIGLSKEQIKIQNSGANLQIGFNPRYFIDALKVITDETIKISFTSSIGPCIITAAEHERYLYLILPVRIKNA
ncbi:MAG: DNA polymerase III subunit beta [Clostridia bacterium]|nr:DNA polymerase III subunit beta [Clostridia bacterium]